MPPLFDAYLTQLRNKTTDMTTFRHATHRISLLLAQESANHLQTKLCTIETPLTPTQGTQLSEPVILVAILRSGLALLPPFLEYYRGAPTGFVGLEREESTAKPHLYYLNIPSLTEQHRVIVLDPMLATGGTMCKTLEILTEHGVAEEKLLYISIIGAPEGCKSVKERFPKAQGIIGQIDDHLNEKKFIVPGLGDFGDRYFGLRSLPF